MQSRSEQTRGLVFGGLMAALVVVFSLIPGLSVLMPIPLVLAFVRYGGRTAVLVAVAATLFNMMFNGLVSGILVIPAGILPGLAFGLGFRRKWRPLSIGIVAVLTYFLGFALTYVVTRLAMFGGRDPFVALLEEPATRTLVDQMVAVMVSLAETIESTATQSGGTLTPAQTQMVEQYRQMAEMLQRDPVGVIWTLLPASLFFSGVVSSAINYLLCRFTLPRFGHEVPAWTPFAEFQLPTWSVWLYIVMSLLAPFFLRGDMTALPWWGKLLLNIFSPMMMIFMLAGAAVAYGFLRKHGLGAGGAAAIVVVGTLLLGQLGPQVLVLLALWDTVFDVRGLGHGIWKRQERTG